MGGGGSQAPNVMTPESKSSIQLGNRASVSSNNDIADLLAQYGSGQISLQDALAKGKGLTSPQTKTYSDADAASYADANLPGAIQDWNSKHPLQTANPDEIRSSLQREYGYNLSKSNASAQSGSEGGYNQFVQDLTTDPLSAQRYGTDELRNNDLTKGLFGDGGLQDTSQAMAKRYQGEVGGDTDAYKAMLDEIQGGDKFKLNENDNTAYGQMSGDIARMYGSQESDLAQSLADRGLGAAPSGAAVAGFSGIQGNKMEQLAGAQRQVLQDRINQAMQQYQLQGQLLGQKGNLDLGALNSSSGTATNLGALGQTALSNLYNRDLTGRQQTQNELGNAADKTLQNQMAYQNQLNQGFQQDQSSQGPSFGDILGGAGALGIGALTGGVGAGAGTALAGSLFGQASNNTPIQGPSGSTANPYSLVDLNKYNLSAGANPVKAT